MIASSHELRLFSTPWHWLVHGLGMGQHRGGFDATRADRIVALAHALHQRQHGGFAGFALALVQTIVAACDPASAGAGPEPCAELGAHLAALRDPVDHARASAAAVESLVKLGHPPARGSSVYRQLVRALAQTSARPTCGDATSYATLHLLVNLVVAAGQAHWAELISPDVCHAGTRLLASIDDLFYYARGVALWQLARMVTDPRAHVQAIEPLRRVVVQVDRQRRQIATRPSDGLHDGPDYLAFALFVPLGALAVASRGALLDDGCRWIDVARAELAALSPRGRASQTLFLVAVLRNAGVLAHHVPDGAALVRDTAAHYLAATDGRQLDDYLRCSYLVHLADQLGCPAALPPAVGHILADSCHRLDTPGPLRATSYGSPLMVVAYVLSALHAGTWSARHALRTVALASIVRAAPARSDDGVTIPRLGLALIDAALGLRAERKAGHVADLAS